MSLILPKGIVVNSPQIGSTIERINTEPLDLADIAKFWKVYTTTKRRLLDPTAERLENYWWRIWGSRSRELNGATVARLFVHISDGETFVPLRGPPNRDESGKPSNSRARLEKTASSTSVLRAPEQSRPSPSPTSASGGSSSRTPAPMPHPILKKTRGPSGNGPRPTARFISPAVSEDESAQPDSSSTNDHVVVQSPSPPPAEETNTKNEKMESIDKKIMPAGNPNKKYVALSAGKKKRPVVVRRHSSQTSQSSNESGTKRAEGPQSKVLSRPPPLSGKTNKNTNAQENTTPSTRSIPSPTKRIASKAGARGGSRKPLESTREEVSNDVDSAQVGMDKPDPTTDVRVAENNQAQSEIASGKEDINSKKELVVDTLMDVPKIPATTPIAPSPDSQTSKTSINSGSAKAREHRDISGKQLLHHHSKGSVSFAPTLTDATGHLDLGNGAPSMTTNTSPDRPGMGRSRGLVKDLFSKKPVPQLSSSVTASSGSAVPESSAAFGSSAPLSNSKSQLSLLLERDRVRSEELKSPTKKGKKSK